MIPGKLHLNRYLLYGTGLLLAGSVFVLGYFTERTNHIQLIGMLTMAFGFAYVLYMSDLNLSGLVLFGIVLRLIIFLMFPNLSDDIFRFVWDGQLFAAGLDPFEILPSEIAKSGIYPPGTSRALYDQLNSPDYFTVYPPLMQYIFYASATIAGSDVFYNVLFLRSIILSAEIGLLYIFFRRDPSNRNILFYALNPAVILEITGNLHFEGLMLFFLVTVVWYIASSPMLAGMGFAAAVSVKLLPLIFGPLLLLRQLPRKWIAFFSGAVTILAVVSVPLFSESLMGGMQESLALYFNKFEFNASIYYLIRAVGYWRFGYNDIAFIGPFLGWVSVVVILLLSYRFRKAGNDDLLTVFGILLTSYLFLSTTVHPWYIATAVGLMVFSRLRYAAVWSYAAMFSYVGYTADGYQVPYLWIIFEYSLVFAVLILDIRTKSPIYEDKIH